MFGIGAELSYLFSIIYTFYNSELLGMPVRPLDKGGRFAASFQNQNVCVKHMYQSKTQITNYSQF
jgi:hypothetical protein